MGLLDRRTGEVLRSTRSGRPGARKRKLLPYLLTVAALVLLAPLSAVSPSTAHAQGAVAIQFGDPNNWLSWEVSTGEQPGFQATNYPETNFTGHRAPFGRLIEPSHCPPNWPLPPGPNTPWPSQNRAGLVVDTQAEDDILLRRHFSLNSDRRYLAVTVRVDNDAQVWMNGRDISGWQVKEGCPRGDKHIHRFYADPSKTVTGDNVIAVRAHERNADSPAYIDVEVIAATPQEAFTLATADRKLGDQTLDPVHTRLGVFQYSHTDAAIPGRGPSPVFTRTYDPATTSGPLGPGWTHSYAIAVVDVGDGSGDKILLGPGGQRDRYWLNPDGTFGTPMATATTLVFQSSQYIATHPDQSLWTFDSSGKLLNIKDRFGNTSTMTYNGSGQLTGVSDPAGRGSLTLGYTSGKLTGVSDWSGRSVAVGYDGSGRLSTVADRNNKTTTYGYDGTSDRLATITDARGHVAVTNVYDSQGRVQSQKDARGVTTGEATTFNYVDNGDGTSTTTVTYPTISADSNWHLVEEDTYDGLGRITRRVSKPTADPNEWITEQYDYDTFQAGSFRTSVTDGRGNTTRFCYDVDYDGTYGGSAIPTHRGNLTRRIDPAPSGAAALPVTLYKYDQKNNLVQVVPPKGVASGGVVDCATNLSSAWNVNYATDLAYDAATQTKLEATTRRYTDPDTGLTTATTKFEYADAANPGLVTRVIPPRGNTGPSPDYSYATQFTYGTVSQAGMLDRVTDPLGNITDYDYDPVGRRTKMVDPNGFAPGGVQSEHTWEYEYDTEDRVKKLKAPAPFGAGDTQLITEFRYDEVGNRTAVIDANGQATRYVYDERDALSQVVQSPNAWLNPDFDPTAKFTTEYSYDNFGNLQLVSRAKGDAANERATLYLYDGLNRVRLEAQYQNWPDTSVALSTISAYDRNSNRTAVLDPASQLTTLGYDNLNRVTSTSYSDGATPNASYGYDANGNRTSMTDGTGSTAYTYDELNRLLSVAAPAGSVGYRYDRDGNRTKLIYPGSSQAVTYTFDQGSRLQSMADWASRTTSYDYFADGSVKKQTNFNGTTTEYAYDKALRLKEVWNKAGGSTLTKHDYEMDKVGNRTKATETLPLLGSPLVWGFDDGEDDDDEPAWASARAALAHLNGDPVAEHMGRSVGLASISGSTFPAGTSRSSGMAFDRLASAGNNDGDGPVLAQLPATATLPALATSTATPVRSVTPTSTGTAVPRSPTPGLATPTASPAASGTAGPSPTSTPSAAAATRPFAMRVGRVYGQSAPPAPLVFADRSADARSAYLYNGESTLFAVDVFEKASSAANVRVRDPNSGAAITFELSGAASSRSAAGGVASAQVGTASVRWSAFSDHLKEEISLPSRPAGDRVAFAVRTSGLTFDPDGRGGYWAQDADGLPRFAIHAPTVKDAAGMSGAARLTLDPSTATIAIDPAFLAAARYPITIDPTVYSGAWELATYNNNGAKLAHDAYGKQVMVTINGSLQLVVSWSNDAGATWTSATPLTETGYTPTFALDPSNPNYLHLAYDAGNTLQYRRLALTRDGSNNITGVITASPAPVLLDFYPQSESPSLIVDKNGLPAVAWDYAGSGTDPRWQVRFLRATGDPTVATNWKNVLGNSAVPDALGTRAAGSVSGSVSLQRMPRGAPASTNDDALYLFWQDSDSSQLTWSKATVSGAGYAAWTAPAVQDTASGGLWNLATAPDVQNRGIVVAYHRTGDAGNKIIRKSGTDDTSTTLLDTTLWGSPVSLAIDRGDIFLFYVNPSGSLAVRALLPPLPWGDEAIVDPLTTNRFPAARPDISDGVGNLAWTHSVTSGTWEVVDGTWTPARPYVKNLRADPNELVPEAGSTSTITYTLTDDTATSLTVTARVYDQDGNLVKTLFTGTQPVGNQSLNWDGKNDTGSYVAVGRYAVKINASDGLLTSPDVRVNVAMRQVIGYSYDKLYRLTGVTAPSGITSYTYDPVGNRLTMVRGLQTTAYTYDRADRITSAGGVLYSSDPKGNVTGRGADSFGYDQPNRLKSTTINGQQSTYTYDGDGKRASRIPAGGPQVSYVYDVNRSLPVVLDDGTRRYVWGLGLTYAVSGSNLEVYHVDGLGSVRAVTDTNGSVVQAYERDEFGVPTSTQGTSNQPFGFTGEQRDSESELLYLRARMYEPKIGRFVQRDRFGGLASRPPSANRYPYALNNPCTHTDPSGLFTCTVAVGASLSGGGAAGFSIGIALDDRGNFAVVPSLIYGGSAGLGVSATASLAVTNLESVFLLGGPFLNAGLSLGPVAVPIAGGFDVIIDPSERGIVGAQIGLSGSWRGLPIEIHGVISNTLAIWQLQTWQYALIKAMLPGPFQEALNICELEAALVRSYHKTK